MRRSYHSLRVRPQSCTAGIPPPPDALADGQPRGAENMTPYICTSMTVRLRQITPTYMYVLTQQTAVSRTRHRLRNMVKSPAPTCVIINTHHSLRSIFYNALGEKTPDFFLVTPSWSGRKIVVRRLKNENPLRGTAAQPRFWPVLAPAWGKC